MTATDVQVLVQLGTTVVPAVVTTVEAIVGFINANGGNADVVAQLQANAIQIAADDATLAQEAAST